MIYHLTPWLTGNIGGGLNASIGLLPDDAWVCIRDGDTMFLTPKWGEQVEKVVANRPAGVEVISCMTNRLRAAYQLHGGVLSDDPDIGNHIAIAKQRWQEHGASVAPVDGPVAGMCMIFSKATWERHPFLERTISFDSQFCWMEQQQGGKIGVALGIYLFHSYRWGHKDPTSYVGHLA